MRINHGLANGYRSGLEDKIAAQLRSVNLNWAYEETRICFTQPAKNRRYTPDFEIEGKKCAILIETKGRFTLADRQKHIMIKEQHPDLDIRFVFQNSRARISKGSKTRYSDWCEKNGFKYADKLIPLEWIEEAGI
jgi:hypothetical protein